MIYNDRQTYLAVVTTSTRADMIHDTARPHAVVQCDKETGHINFVMRRFETYRGACISCAHWTRKHR